jgi:hypothetical protein
MIATLISILFSFVLLSIIGTTFAQRLQHKNWLRQQNISIQDRRISDLNVLFIDLDNLLSRRLYKTRRLLYALRRSQTIEIKDRLNDYDSVLTEWNEKRNSFQIRLVRVISVELANHFEHLLSQRFVHIGSRLERLTRAYLQNQLPNNFRETLTTLEDELDVLSRTVYEFLREIYINLQAEQERLYKLDSDNKIPTTAGDLDQVSAWYLFKSLFVPPSKSFKES